MKTCAKMLVVLLLALQLMTGITSSAETGDIQTILNDFGIDEYQGKQFALSSSNSLTSTYQIPSGETIILNSDGQLQSIFRTNLLSEKYGKATNSPAISNEQLITKLDELVAKKYIPSEFVLESQNDYDIGFREFVYLEKTDNSINPFNSVKIAYDTSSGALIYFNRIKEYSSDLSPTLDSKQAHEITEEYLKSKEIELASIQYYQTKVEKDDYLTLVLEPQHSFYLVHQFKVNDGERVISVDSISGKVLSDDIVEAYDSRSHYIKDNDTSVDTKRLNRATNYNSIFYYLGYTGYKELLANDSTGRQKILNYLGGANSWGYSYSGHATEDIIAAKYISWFQVHRTEVTGIWSLVVLDGCNTAKNDNWANAFQIYANNSIGRVFIGWNEKVLVSKAEKFSNYFMPAVRDNRTATLLSNVYTAIANIPDNDTYWIRYIGDPNTTGRR